jgi:hypothetical protein
MLCIPKDFALTPSFAAVILKKLCA